MSSSDREEQLMELEALRAIFMEDFRSSNESDLDIDGEHSIKVVPYTGGALVNNLAVVISWRYEKDYPSKSPIKQIRLESVEGKLMPESLKFLTDFLITQAQSFSGQTSIYLLIEKLKEQLEYYNEGLSSGSFIILPDETLREIFEYLEARELGVLSGVAKRFRKLSEQDRLWEKICRKQPEFARYTADHPNVSFEAPFWKNLYLDMMDFKYQEPKFIASIVMRKGTGDEWPNHITSFKEIFINGMAKNFSVILKKTKNISFEDYPHVKGRYKFLDIETVSRMFPSAPWLNHQTGCPYTAETIGYFAWTTNTSVGEMLCNVAALGRGILARWDKPSCFIPAVVEQPVGVFSLLNVPSHKSLPLMINPDNVNTKIKYLSDVVDAVNKKLAILLREVPGNGKKKQQHYSNQRIFVDYVDQNRFYPFKLDTEPFKPVLKKLFTTGVKLWVLNFAGLPTIFDSKEVFHTTQPLLDEEDEYPSGSESD